MNPFPHKTDRKERKSSPNFAAPTRDQLTTGRFMPAGDEHGVGFRTPVGTKGASPYSSGPIPMQSKCFDPKDIA